jgi:hypothetical protein
MKQFKKIFAIVMAFVFVVAVAAVGEPTEVYAATTYTFVKGEVMSFTDYSNVKSVKSSNSKVVSVKKDEDNSKYFILSAKKTGTAKITIKTEYGTKNYNIKVVASDFTVEVKTIATPGTIIYKVTNNTKVTYDTLRVSYTLKDSDGDELETDSFSVYDLAPGSSAFKEVSYSSYSYTPSVKKCTGKVDLKNSDRSPFNYTYTKRTDKLKVTVTDTVDGDYVNFKVKFKSSYAKSMDAAADIILYDSDDHIIGIKTVTEYLSGKETSTDTYKYYLYKVEYDHYKVVTRAYSREYN